MLVDGWYPEPWIGSRVKEVGVKILEAAQASGLSADRIRLYERQGVLPQPPREANGYREYTEEHLVSLRLAKALRDLDLPLERVGEMISVWHDGTCGELRGALMTQLDEALARIDTQLADLEQANRQVHALRTGLSRMRTSHGRVPGTTPCGCVRLLGAGD